MATRPLPLPLPLLATLPDAATAPAIGGRVVADGPAAADPAAAGSAGAAPLLLVAAPLAPGPLMPPGTAATVCLRGLAGTGEPSGLSRGIAAPPPALPLPLDDAPRMAGRADVDDVLRMWPGAAAPDPHAARAAALGPTPRLPLPVRELCQPPEPCPGADGATAALAAPAAAAGGATGKAGALRPRESADLVTPSRTGDPSSSRRPVRGVSECPPSS